MNTYLTGEKSCSKIRVIAFIIIFAMVATLPIPLWGSSYAEEPSGDDSILQEVTPSAVEEIVSEPADMEILDLGDDMFPDAIPIEMNQPTTMAITSSDSISWDSRTHYGKVYKVNLEADQSYLIQLDDITPGKENRYSKFNIFDSDGTILKPGGYTIEPYDDYGNMRYVLEDFNHNGGDHYIVCMSSDSSLSDDDMTFEISEFQSNLSSIAVPFSLEEETTQTSIELNDWAYFEWGNDVARRAKVFSVELEQYEKYIFTLETPSEDACMMLFDSDEYGHENKYGTTEKTNMIFTPNDTDTYYILCYGDSGPLPQMTFSASVYTDTFPPGWEAFGTLPGEQTMTPSESIINPSRYGYSECYATIYSVSFDSEQLYRLTLAAADLDYDFIIYLNIYDEGGNFIAGEDGSHDLATGFSPENDGTYYILCGANVAGKELKLNIDYSDESLDNAATPITIPTTQNFELTSEDAISFITKNGYVSETGKLYKASLDADSSYKIDFGCEDDEYVLIRIYNSAGEREYSQSDYNGKASLIYEAENAGTYYIFCSTDADQGNFDFSIKKQETNIIDNAQEITAIPTNGSISITTQDELYYLDYNSIQEVLGKAYKVHLNRNTIYEFTMSGDSPSWMVLVDEDEEYVNDQIDINNQNAGLFRPDETGYYYIIFGAYSPDDFDFSIDYYTDNFGKTASPLTLNVPTSATITYDDWITYYQYDYNMGAQAIGKLFSITLTEGGIYDIILNQDHDSPCIVIFDSSGNVLQSKYGEDGEDMNKLFMPNDTATYYVLCSTDIYDDGDTADITVTVSESNLTDNYDAIELELGTPTNMAITHNMPEVPYKNNNWLESKEGILYSIDLTKGDIFDITLSDIIMAGYYEPLNPSFLILDSSGSLIYDGNSYDSENSIQRYFIPDEDGKYYILCYYTSHWSVDTTFELSVQPYESEITKDAIDISSRNSTTTVSITDEYIDFINENGKMENAPGKIYKADFDSNKYYKLSLLGNDENIDIDHFLGIYDSNGILLEWSEGYSMNDPSEFSFSPDADGTYYIVCAAYSENVELTLSINEIDAIKLSGNVTHSNTPVSGIEINCNAIVNGKVGSYIDDTETDRNGGYSLILEPGTYLLTFKNYNLNSNHGTHYEVVTVVASGSDITRDISMTNGKILEGEVISSFDMFDDSFYLFKEIPLGNGQKLLISAGEDYLDSDRSGYSFDRLSAGDYILYYKGYDSNAHLSQYYNGPGESTNDITAAERITIADSDRLNMDFTLSGNITPEISKYLGSAQNAAINTAITVDIQESNSRWIEGEWRYGLFYKANLIKGKTYTMILDQIPSYSNMDPYLYLYDSKGALIEKNDDTPLDDDSLNSYIKFTPSENGTYYFLCDTYSTSFGKLNFRIATDLTVSYNSAGGSSVASKSYAYNSKIGTLPTPKRSGYTFDGWYIGNTKVNANYTVTSDVTLTAKWLSSNNKIKKLKASTGKWSPKFKSTKTKYKLTLSKKKKSVKITATMFEKAQKVQIKIGKKGKYKTKKSIKVSVNKGKSKVVYIKVTSQDKKVKTYKITVKRKK